MSFSPQHQKFIDTLENPGLNVGQQLIRTAGQGGGRVKSYVPPTDAIIAKTRTLFANLYAFDTDPSDNTIAQLQNSLKDLNMKAVQVADAPEWIYITPDAKPGSKQWETYSKKTQFDLSWHVGSDSKVAISDEHNGGDGAFRVVGELVKQGTNFKLVMSNSRNRATSEKKGRRYQGDWAHSKATIDFPIMSDLARQGYSVINVHGMASKDYGLLVNNYSSNFIKTEPSLPTFIGIALAQYFNDSNNKKFIFGGVLPGSAIINGVQKPLSPPNNKKTSANSLYLRATGVQNTNTIGNTINSINARMAGRKPGDSGKSCHIEFGIVRDGRADLRKVVAAINLAAFWMNNYKPELNPWTIIKNDPNFDMLKYGDLYNPSPEVMASLSAIASDDSETDTARIAADVDSDGDDFDDLEHYTDEPAIKSAKPVAALLPSGGPKKVKENNAEEKQAKLEAKLAPTP